MRKLFVIFYILFLFTSLVYSQQIKINVAYVNLNKATLYSLSGEKTTFIDSIYSSNPEEFVYPHKNVLHNGIYRFKFDKNKWIDFIYDGKDISLRTDENNVLDSLSVITSESNKLFYTFIRLNKAYKTKTELLLLILARYPKDDDYYSQTQKRLGELQTEYKEFVDVASQKEPNSFIAEYIHSAQLPVIDYEIPPQQIDYLKTHALDNVDFNNSLLVDSDLFTNKAIEYLTYYRNPQLPKDLLEQEFMKAVDTLLNKAKVNQLVYQHITDYLIDGFKKFGFDKIIDYIVENYVIKDDLCLDEKTENSIQRRIDQSKLLAVGTKAPNIIMPDINGDLIDISAIQSDKTLIVFYSTQCPHCKILLPQLNEFQQQQKNLKILAISLDNKPEEWSKFVYDNKLDLTNLNDPNGWDGQVATDYYIYATPTLFLLDIEKKIVGKPTTFGELEVMLE